MITKVDHFLKRFLTIVKMLTNVKKHLQMVKNYRNFVNSKSFQHISTNV